MKTKVLVWLLTIGLFAFGLLPFLPNAKTAAKAVEIPSLSGQTSAGSPSPFKMRHFNAAAVSNAAKAPPPAANEQKGVTLLFAGDVMAHKKQVDSHKFGASYDFTGDYKYIKDIVSAADIAVANLETPLSGKGPYKGYPRFNAPDALAEALFSAGFDIIATANNHIRDQKDAAMKRTASFLNRKGFTVTGTSPKGGPKYAAVEKNGIRLGFVNFTVSLNQGLPKASIPYVNCLWQNGKYDEGFRLMKKEINGLKARGAEFITVVMHWGSEYRLKGNKTQQSMAKKIADMGADLIIGAHPHVLQNVAEYKSPVSGKNVLIYYSLGNLVSNQPYGYGAGKGNCETGALALIKLKRAESGAVVIDEAGFLTTYVHKPNIKVQYTENKKKYTKTTRAYYIVPARNAAKNPSGYVNAKGALLKHIKQGVSNGKTILGKSGKSISSFEFREYAQWPW